MVGNPDTPGISPDTPDLEHSGYRPETPDLGVRILQVLIRILQKFRMFQIEVRRFRVCRIEDVGLSRVVVRVYGLGLFQSYKSYCMHSHVICIRVDTAAE